MNYRDIIESRYNREAWQQLLHDIFRSKVSFWREPSAVHASSRLAKQALNIGKISLADGESIAIYEVELTDNVDIERNRRGIRDMLTTDWRNMGYAGAFMFCYRQNESVLRFSYVSESWSFADDGTYKKDSTDTRRFTYLLGEGHRSRTAIQQFESLKKSGLSLKDLTKAFSVEAVGDMFFDDYKQQYEDIIAFITGKRMVKRGNKWEETIVGEPNPTIFSEFRVFADSEKAIRDYVKKLMGRLVFLQFLQKKGWLGVSVNAKWGDGDREFIQHLFENAADKDTFVDNVLEPLFNDINTERDGDIASPAVGKDIRVPYLNGGLFEPDAADAVNFPLPARFMKSMLDFFASYNFTIDENDPDDAEMGVDPEMLGRIFENLLEDNKDKGAFYTPKEIVQYMCRESLIAYLQTDIEKEEQKEAIRQFVTTHKFVEHLPGDTLEMLKNVKICDPAIGSGAFPMGLLKELYLCRATLEGFDQKKAAEIKKHIIQQNIYGVDIERGAVDTARLRFWLALIVDEESPEALPNLDFKIMQGNSLLEQYKGTDLSNITEKKVSNDGMFSIFDDMLDVYRKDLRKLLAQYFDCADHKKKLQLRKDIVANVKKQLSEQGTECDFGDLDIVENDQFFMWHTWFYDVFANGGFDIVIGNPPYGAELSEIQKDFLKSKYDYLVERLRNSYLYFMGIADLLSQRGVISYIVPNEFLFQIYMCKARRYFLENTTILQVINVGESAFDAVVPTCIFLLNHDKKESYNISLADIRDKDIIKDKNVLKETSFVKMSNIQIHNNPLSTFTFDFNKTNLITKLLRCPYRFENFCIDVFNGVCTSCNEVYIVDGDTIEQNAIEPMYVKPSLKGEHISRYHQPNDPPMFLLYIKSDFRFDLAPNTATYLRQNKDLLIKKCVEKRKGNRPWYELFRARNEKALKITPKILIRQTGDSIVGAIDNFGYYSINSTNIILLKEEFYSDIEFLLAILNSKLLKFYYQEISQEGGRVLAEIKPIRVRNLPIPSASKDEKVKIAELAKEIMNVKNDDITSDVTNIDDNIDFMVYHLYGLTYDEVLIVDPETPITREEYEKS